MFQLEQRYAKLRTTVETACAHKDPQVADTLRQFCAVLICGYVERSVEIIVIERLKEKAHPKVLNFVKSHFKKGSNYHCGAITSLLERFDADWKRRFEELILNLEADVEGMNSIYTVRNTLAHGGNVSISSGTLQERLASAKKVVDALVQSTA